MVIEGLRSKFKFNSCSGIYCINEKKFENSSKGAFLYRKDEKGEYILVKFPCIKNNINFCAKIYIHKEDKEKHELSFEWNGDVENPCIKDRMYINNKDELLWCGYFKYGELIADNSEKSIKIWDYYVQAEYKDQTDEHKF